MRRRICSILAAALLVLCCQTLAWAESWRKIKTWNDGSMVFVDINSLKKLADGSVIVWQKSLWSKTAQQAHIQWAHSQSKDRQAEERLAREATFIIDQCQYYPNRTYNLRETHYYNRMGNEISSHHYRHSSPGNIVPNTLPDIVFHFVLEEIGKIARDLEQAGR